MTPATAGLAAALVAGMVTSLHCVGMCGPLACSVCLRGPGRRVLPLAAYHTARIVSYAAVGALAGAFGRLVAGEFMRPLAGFLPWIFLGFFVGVAAGWDKRAGLALQGFGWSAPWIHRVRRGGPVTLGGLLGLATPFVPCGPLYLMAGAAIVSGSGSAGAALLAVFALGTMPVPLLVQAGVGTAAMRVSPLTLDRLRRGFAAVSVVVLLGRALGPLGSSSSLLCR